MTRRPKALVLNADQVRCIASPLRSEMMGTAVRLHQFSVNEMAVAIGHNPKALYPHIRQMMDVGLLKQVDERLSGKRMEAIYAPVSMVIEIPRDNFDPEYREAIKKKMQAVVRQVERDQLRYLETVQGEDLSFALRYFLKLPPERIHELKKRLMEVADWADSFSEEPGSVEISTTFMGVPLPPRKEG